MTNSGKISIENMENRIYREIKGYQTTLFKCALFFNEYREKKLLANYSCCYTLKKDKGKAYIEYPELDLQTEITCTAPDEFSICMVTELYPNKDNVTIQAMFNIYRQSHYLGNKKFYDTKIIDVYS